MLDCKSILAIIPARGGSKGIPGKNIKKLAGRPLIDWTIKEAQKSKYIDRLVISTDSTDIAKVGKNLGVEIPFLRPSKYAKDNSTGTDVILNALDWFKKKDKTYDYFILLQPTSPFRKVEHIDNALEMIISNFNIDSLVSIQQVDQHPYWMKTLNESGYIEQFSKKSNVYANRQSLPKYYINNGSIYICKWDIFINDKSFYKCKCYPFIMDKKHSIDLDTMDDWKYAEYLLK